MVLPSHDQFLPSTSKGSNCRPKKKKTKDKSKCRYRIISHDALAHFFWIIRCLTSPPSLSLCRPKLRVKFEIFGLPRNHGDSTPTKHPPERIGVDHCDCYSRDLPVLLISVCVSMCFVRKNKSNFIYLFVVGNLMENDWLIIKLDLKVIRLKFIRPFGYLYLNLYLFL